MVYAEDDGAMAWQTDVSKLIPGSSATADEARDADAAPERQPFDCPTATFDGSLRDPRTLVYLYQQRLRATLLARVAEEAAHPSSLRQATTVCQDALGTCEDGLRWLWLAEPRHATRKHPGTAPRPVSAPRLRLVPSRGRSTRPALSPA